MLKMKFNYRKIAALAILPAVLLTSCGGSNDNKGTENQIDTTSTVVLDKKTSVLNAVDSLLALIPKPSTVPNIIARTGAEYRSSLLCDGKAADRTVGNSSATAFCLGAYGADIAYMAAYDKGKDAVASFVSGKKMADRIGVSNAFDAEMLESVERNLSNKDSLILLTDATLKKSSDLLKSGEQAKDAALLSAGAVIEGLYITGGLIREFPSTGLPKAEQDKILVPLYKAIIDQEASVNSLVSLLQKTGEDPEATKLLGMLKELSGIYKKGDWANKVASNKGGFSPSYSELSELDAAVGKIRTAMIP